MILFDDTVVISRGRAPIRGHCCPARPSLQQRKKVEGMRVKVRQKEAEKVERDGDEIAIDGGSSFRELKNGGVWWFCWEK
ncbi:hypothetical protein C1H46_016070 [Malus baccata]|uniref:Uncharacterized protein n=1 Tax=Malus baccata TaxID=106549 RepID=A0A540MIG5_MALBA|nr:hypothetical protein C1H46_016070 [Malus baccata]